MWIDTHCHPFADTFDGDREAMIQRAREAGVEKMLVVGFDPKTNRQAVEFADKNADMWATVGVHPCDAGALTDYNKAAESGFSSGELYRLKAMSEHLTGNKTQACADFDKAIALGDALAGDFKDRFCK